MEVGMLWFDDGPAKLGERVQRAVEYYADKYGRKPNVCLVNPQMIDGKGDKVDGVQVRSANSVMPGHFWIGVEQAAKANGNANGGSSSESKAGGSRAKRGTKKKAA